MYLHLIKKVKKPIEKDFIKTNTKIESYVSTLYI